MISLYLSLHLVIFTNDMEVSQKVIEEFEKWPHSKTPPDFSAPPPLMNLYPGMSRATQVIPKRVRQFLISQFKKSNLSDEEWAERWKAVEAQLLGGPYGILDTLEVLETLGSEVFEEMKLELGLFSEELPPLRGAIALRFFLLNEENRKVRFKEIMDEMAGLRDPRLAVVQKVILQEGLVKDLSREQRQKLANFLLEIYDQFKSRDDLSEIKDLFKKNFKEMKQDFEKEFGFSMPKASKLYDSFFRIDKELKRGNLK